MWKMKGSEIEKKRNDGKEERKGKGYEFEFKWMRVSNRMAIRDIFGHFYVEKMGGKVNLLTNCLAL